MTCATNVIELCVRDSSPYSATTATDGYVPAVHDSIAIDDLQQIAELVCSFLCFRLYFCVIVPNRFIERAEQV